MNEIVLTTAIRSYRVWSNPIPMLRYNIFLSLMLTACAAFNHSADTLPPPTKTITFYDGSTIQTPIGFTLSEEVGDCPVVFGSLNDMNTGTEISYRSGEVFGEPYNPADRQIRKKAGDAILYHGRNSLNGLVSQITVARDGAGQKMLYISFPSTSTCFYTAVQTQADIKRIQKIILTFKPKPPDNLNIKLQ